MEEVESRDQSTQLGEQTSCWCVPHLGTRDAVQIVVLRKQVVLICKAGVRTNQAQNRRLIYTPFLSLGALTYMLR